MSESFIFNGTASESEPEPFDTETVEPTPRRRGRPPGSRNKPREAGQAQSAPNAEAPRRRKRKPKPEDIEFATRRLMGLHSIMASFTGVPELNLSQIEAEMLAKAGLEVQREFDIEVGGKWVVLASFISVAGMIYVPRMRIVVETAKRRKAKRENQVVDSIVVNEHGNPTN